TDGRSAQHRTASEARGRVTFVDETGLIVAWYPARDAPGGFLEPDTARPSSSGIRPTGPSLDPEAEPRRTGSRRNDAYPLPPPGIWGVRGISGGTDGHSDGIGCGRARRRLAVRQYLRAAAGPLLRPSHPRHRAGAS